MNPEFYDEYDEEDYEDEYCDCQNSVIEEEEIAGRCFCCGKLLP